MQIEINSVKFILEYKKNMAVPNFVSLATDGSELFMRVVV